MVFGTKLELIMAQSSNPLFIYTGEIVNLQDQFKESPFYPNNIQAGMLYG